MPQLSPLASELLPWCLPQCHKAAHNVTIYGMKDVWIINGPNLNLLGLREPTIYGSQTIADVERLCQEAAARSGLGCECRQSNHEGVLIDWLQEAGARERTGNLVGVVLNAGAYTHTSIAMHDAIKGSGLTVLEVHISDIHARESFRHHSYITPVARQVIIGKGVQGYVMAVEMLSRINADHKSAEH
jgi:3-dehydroquinate dehydratase II